MNAVYPACNLYTIELSLVMFGLILLKAGPAPKRSIDRQMLKYQLQKPRLMMIFQSYGNIWKP